jgi:AcrR family transcriptional regulator
MDARDRILQAAAHVYAESGFRGATTRRIAAEAGVNEVTLFRIFGSKTALLDEVLQAGASHIPVTRLPEVPADPLRELTLWCGAHLEHLRASRALTRKMMSELEERPAIAPCAGSGPTCAALELRGYLERLARAGLAPAGDPTAAVAMLLGTLFSDAMGRDIWPNVFPQPATSAPRKYARLFLRAIGVPAAPAGAAGDVTRGGRTRVQSGTGAKATAGAKAAPRAAPGTKVSLSVRTKVGTKARAKGSTTMKMQAT